MNFKRLKNSRAAKNAGASYLAFVSTTLCGLFSIPVAVHYLTKEEIGLWSTMHAIVGYLLWLDLGIGDATGRKMADAVANDDRTEINRWWTLSVGILTIQGVALLVVGTALAAILPTLLGFAGGPLASTAFSLFLGLAVVSAFSMPFRVYPGILLAQERFHWVPITQAYMPWIQFGVFWFLLSRGCGVFGYMWGLAAAQISAWIQYSLQIHVFSISPRPDFNGFKRKRFNDLFAFSSNLAFFGVSRAILSSIPAIILTRFGGLALVPVYNFTGRAPGMITSIAQRTNHAFLPNLQRLYISGDRDRFRNKYREVNQLTVWISLGIASVVLAFNRPLISWLANSDFFAGHWTNLWLACGCLVVPFSGNIFSLLQYSGNMGKSGVFTLAQIVVAAPLGWLALRQCGLPGVAAVFVFLPLVIQTPYGWIRGARNCGFSGWDLCGRASISFAISIAMVLIAGAWIASGPASGHPIEILGRATSMPTIRELAAGITLGTVAIAMTFSRLKFIQKS
jgi:O-antigen/teichoic acid export membrane protein